MFGPVGLLIALLRRGVTAVVRRTVRAARVLTPGPCGVARGLLADLVRTKGQLLAENAFLRQQLLVAARGVKKPQFRASERALLVTLAAMFSHWRDGLVLVKPDTLLRWHREGFRLWWR